MRIKFVDKAIKLYKRITGRFEPITSKCVHDNIFAIAGQSAFFIILSAVPLSMFFVSLLQNLHIPIDFVYHGLSSVFSSKIADDLTYFLTSAYESAVGISLSNKYSSSVRQASYVPYMLQIQKSSHKPRTDEIHSTNDTNLSAYPCFLPKSHIVVTLLPASRLHKHEAPLWKRPIIATSIFPIALYTPSRIPNLPTTPDSFAGTKNNPQRVVPPASP